MNGGKLFKVFFDTNIILYMYGATDPGKQAIARA